MIRIKSILDTFAKITYMRPLHFVLVALLFTSLGFSQDVSEEEQAKTPTAIENLKSVVEESNNYQQYKVVEKVSINAAIEKISTEFDLLTTEISVLKDSIQSQEQQIQSLKKEVSELNTQLTNLQNQKDEIQFFGTSLTKSLYNTIAWSIVVVLVALLLFLLFKFNRSNLLTKEARQNLKNLDADYENYKRIALEKQQKLGRQLQDEKNKNQKFNKGNTK